VLGGARQDAHPAVLHREVAVGPRHVDVAGAERRSVARRQHGYGRGASEHRREAVFAGAGMDHDEHRRLQLGRQSADHGGHGLDSAGRGTHDDDT
jgi:hypothetical protein